MTVSAAPALAGPFDGNDVATTFPFDFKIFAESDLRIVLQDALSAEYLLTLDVDYSVSMNPDQNADPGGSITYPLSGSPLATGERLTISTGLQLSQQTVFTNLGKFFPTTVEDTFDRVVMLLRQIQAENDRALRVPVSLSDVDTDLPTPVAGAALVWNDDGTALVNGIPSESLIAISSFMSNVIQAVDAAEARSDIGAAADTEVVKLTGAQTIAGVKTFSSPPIIPDAAAAQNPVSKTQLDAETAARTAAIAAAVAPATLAPTLRVPGTAVSASGTAVDFTGIPSWANRVTILFFGLSGSGTSNFMVQIGGGGGIETSGYTGIAVRDGGAGNNYSSTFSAGFLMRDSVAAANAYTGRMVLERVTGNSWLATGSNTRAATDESAYMNGSKTLASTLTQVRFTTVGGADTFDAGTINIIYE